MALRAIKTMETRIVKNIFNKNDRRCRNDKTQKVSNKVEIDRGGSRWGVDGVATPPYNLSCFNIVLIYVNFLN